MEAKTKQTTLAEVIRSILGKETYRDFYPGRRLSTSMKWHLRKSNALIDKQLENLCARFRGRLEITPYHSESAFGGKTSIVIKIVGNPDEIVG